MFHCGHAVVRSRRCFHEKMTHDSWPHRLKLGTKKGSLNLRVWELDQYLSMFGYIAMTRVPAPNIRVPKGANRGQCQVVMTSPPAEFENRTWTSSWTGTTNPIYIYISGSYLVFVPWNPKTILGFEKGPPVDSVNRWFISGWIHWFMVDITN